MAWNGSGLFERIYNWVADANANINITDSRMDAEMDGFATGITACINKNGENTPTTNLPMGGFRHTGVGLSSARTMYARTDQVQDGALVYGTDSGSANTYVLTLSPAISAYAAGQIFIFIANSTNTGASTLNINAVGATSIITRYGTSLPAGAITSGRAVSVLYNGSNFTLLSGQSTALLGAIAPLTNSANKIIRLDGSGSASLLDFLDEDDMSSNSASGLPSQQSVKAYVDSEVASIIPIGGIIAWPNSSVPTNYLECDGSTFSAGTYPDLNTVLGGTTLPDLRGEFVRGWDNGRGVDSGRGIITTQSQSIESHSHTVSNFNELETGSGSFTQGGGGASQAALSTDSAGSAETRPRNVALMYIVRAL